MTSVDKAAIGWSIGIVAAFIAIAFGSQNIQNVAPEVSIPEPSQPVEEAMEPAMEREEPSTQMADPFVADEAAKVKESAAMKETEAEESAAMKETEEGMMAAEEEKSMGEMMESKPTTVNVSIPEGTSVPGCEDTDSCFDPSSVSVVKGSTVIWTNMDTAAHTVTSGTPSSGPSGEFDSGLISAGSTFKNTFDTSGTYEYFCIVHPWMTGSVTVQ